MILGRFYRLSKAVTEEQAEDIVKELENRENVKAVMITEDRKEMRIETMDGKYEDVMNIAVNVISREAGCELSFDRFDVNELEDLLKKEQTAE